MTADDRAKGSRSGGPRGGGDRRRRQPSRGGEPGGGRRRRPAPGDDGRDDERSLTTRGPIGIEGATRTPGAPPRRGERPGEAPERPEIPEDVEVTLPKAVVRELRRSVRRPQDAAEAARSLSLASQRLEEREGADALAHLAWAKHLAPRSPAVREALGVALYLAEDYAGALSELQAYRRFTSRADQNHLVADCLRALGRNTDRIPDLVDAMASEEVPAERRIEGHIVWASMLADDGDVGAGRSVLRRTIAEHDPGDEPEVAHLRLWYVAGDLADRAGDRADARRHFSRITAVAEGFYDTEERLERLG